jgi:hypothetical protein
MMLGWLHRYRDAPLATLSLRSMFPNSDESSVTNAFDFQEFLIHVSTGKFSGKAGFQPS